MNACMVSFGLRIFRRIGFPAWIPESCMPITALVIGGSSMGVKGNSSDAIFPTSFPIFRLLSVIASMCPEYFLMTAVPLSSGIRTRIPFRLFPSGHNFLHQKFVLLNCFRDSPKSVGCNFIRILFFCESNFPVVVWQKIIGSKFFSRPDVYGISV